MSEFLEALMIVCFGISWPLNAYKMYRAKTVRGSSPIFLYFIFFGYVFGICSKIVLGTITYIFIFYIINLITVSLNLIVYYKNKALDRKEERLNN